MRDCNFKTSTLSPKKLPRASLSIRLHFPASIANSENKAKPESDVTPTYKETLNFDDDTSKGEDSCYPLTRIGFLD